MAKFARILIFAILTVMIVFTAGCDIAKKAETLTNDLVNITLDQIALQLENGLNQEFPGIQVNTPQVLGSNGKVDWNQLRQTKLGNFVFFNAGDYEFKAVLSGDGIFAIQRTNLATGENYSYAEFKVDRVDGKFKVTSK